MLKRLKGVNKQYFDEGKMKIFSKFTTSLRIFIDLIQGILLVEFGNYPTRI